MKYILENTLDSVWAIDHAYEIIYVNSVFKNEFKKFYGIELQKGAKILEYFPENIAESWKENYNRAFAGEHFTVVDSYDLPNSNKIYIEVSFSPVVENNTVTGVSCFGRDITENKKDQLELTKYATLLKASIESQRDTILFSLDNNFNYLFYNKAHKDVMKYAYNATIAEGENILQYISNEDDLMRAKANYTKALNGNSHITKEIYGDVNKEYYESFYNPILDQNSKDVVGITVMARNITERIHEQELLKETIATKNKFFSIISHDLRSPLSSIMSLTNYLYKNFDKYNPKRIKELLQNVKEGLNNTFNLLEDLLIWARTQNNSLEFKPEVFEINTIVDKAIELQMQHCNNKGLKVEKDIPANFNMVGDKLMIADIFRNLLSNACKFSNEYEKIIVKVVPISIENNPFIELSVIDFGIGIPKDNLSKILHLEETYTTPGTHGEKGTGLGLHLCNEFVKKHHGNLIIESDINQGTTVKIQLPKKIQESVVLD